MEDKKIQRGDIYYTNLSPAIGSEQDGIRPVLIISNNKGNHYSPCVVAAITTKGKIYLPTHVKIGKEFGLERESFVMLEQIRTIDKSRLLDYIGSLDSLTMDLINKAIGISLGLRSAINDEVYNK